MKRSVVALVALTVLLVSVAASAVTAALVVRGVGDGPGWWPMSSHGRMHDDLPRAGRGVAPGRGSPMHQMYVESEFAYLAEMVAHHREAVQAAEQLRRSQRPELRRFGADIVRSQSAQIDQMTQWLQRWYPGRSTDVDYQPMMRDLDGLRGDALDRAFLEDMIPHHMGAVMMSQQLLDRDLARHPQVATLARSIRDEQHDEIFQMRDWLAEWFGVRAGRWGAHRMHAPQW